MKEMNGIKIRKEEIKVSLHAGDIILYIRLIINFLQLLSIFRKVAGYKNNTQKSEAFLYTNDKYEHNEIREIIPFTTASIK